MVNINKMVGVHLLYYGKLQKIIIFITKTLHKYSECGTIYAYSNSYIIIGGK